MDKRRVLPLVGAVVFLGMGARCSGEDVEIAQSALRDFRSSTHLTVPERITLDDAEISTLARQADVSDDVIRNVAPKLDEEPVWKSSLTKLHELLDAIPDEIKSGTIQVACDAIEDPNMTTDEAAQELYAQFGDVSESEIEQIATSFVDFYNDMHAALQEGDEKAAAVTLSCFVADQAV
jgi:hypothetical protein